MVIQTALPLVFSFFLVLDLHPLLFFNTGSFFSYSLHSYAHYWSPQRHELGVSSHYIRPCTQTQVNNLCHEEFPRK